MLFESKMASSRIEIVSSAPFGCVLKDRNQRERCRDNSARAAFEKNLKSLVRGHFTTSITFSSASASEILDCENLEFMNTNIDENCSNNDESLANMSPGQARILDRWAARQAREVVSTIERQTREAEIQALSNSQAVSSRTSSFLRDTSPSPSDASVEIPNLGGASSLVQMWEARLNRSNILNSNSPVGISSSRTHSGMSCPDNVSSVIVEETQRVIENVKKCEPGNEESSRPITDVTRCDPADEESSRTVKKLKSSVSANAEYSRILKNVENVKKFESGNEESSRPITDVKNYESADDEASKTIKRPKSCESANSESSRILKNVENVKKFESGNEESSRPITDVKNYESADDEASKTIKRPKSCESANSESSRILRNVEKYWMKTTADVKRCEPANEESSGTVKNQRRCESANAESSRTLKNVENHEDSFGDSESDARDSDSGENERVRVSDMVKRLTLGTDNENEPPSTSRAYEQYISLPRIRARWSVLDQAENKIFTPVIKRSPRIRGRQAFNDFFMQMERERHMELSNLVERRVVSGFQQGTRIQSTIRSRFVQGEVSIRESIITIPRERFNTTRNDETGNLETQATDLEILNNYTHNMEISSPSSQVSEDSHLQEELSGASARSSVTCASDVFHEEASQSSDVTWQAASFEASNLDAHAIEENSYWDGNVPEYEQEAYYNNHVYDSSFRDISRPRIHWEDRRQERYQEMLDSDSENVEIRQLLERRRVSTFLSSDFRHTIDQLMASRLNLPPSENHDEEVGSQVRMNQLVISFFDRQEEENEDGEENEEEVYEDEEEEEAKTIGHRYHQVNDYFDQTPSSSINLPLPSPFSSWSSYRDQEVGNDSYQPASTSLRQLQPSSSRSYHHDRRGGSSMNNRSSFEMELMYDMRAQMEQLRQEMVELRSSIKSCTDMQAQMHHTFKQDDHSVQGYRKTPLFNKAPRQGNCCICYEMKVDSLLYRCGHMCTCINCAHELQSSSGKCPVCRAPILDVVRAFADS